MVPVLKYLFILILVSHSPISSATSLHTRTGYELIEALNLHPRRDVNIFKPNTSDSVSITNSRIVEKRLRLPVLGESGATVHDLAHLAGYVRIKHTIGGRMFYYFFQSRNKKDAPVVIWLTGGPGCSSAIGLFYENGPFHLTKNLSLVWNDYGWDKVANMIYIDQPIGTGFSYTSSEKDIRHDEKGVSDDLYDFLQGFFKKHPDYVKNDLYITGESYGGHYIPAFAARINKGNKNKEGIHLNLKGFAIGNGLTEPGPQFGADPDFAFYNKLINEDDYIRIRQMVPECKKAAKKCGTNGTDSCLDASDKCWIILHTILSVNPVCVYDIRRKKCYDLSAVDEFLNIPSVKKALGVPKGLYYTTCSRMVNQAFKADIMRNLEVGLPDLLEDGIEMLIYAGKYDLVCNLLGNIRWVTAMKWSGQSGFEASEISEFKVDGKLAGLLKSHGPLTFLEVRDAGHMVPMDQPKASLQMLKMWMDGKLNFLDASRLLINYLPKTDHLTSKLPESVSLYQKLETDTVPLINLEMGKKLGAKQPCPLTFLKVHNAGHMVPVDQSKASFQMLKMWMDRRLKMKIQENP
ncbi:serine carboxypeptidase-like protein [Tanacetum coccineum]